MKPSEKTPRHCEGPSPRRSVGARTTASLLVVLGCGGVHGGLPPAQSAPDPGPPTYPEADTGRFTVAVAQLSGDDDDEVRRRVVQRLAGLATRAEHRIQVVLYPVSVEVGESADLGLRETEGHRGAQRILAEGGADLLLWGRVEVYRSEVIPVLFWTVAGGDRHLGHRDVQLDGARLPERFLEDYQQALELVVLSQATMLDSAEASWALPQVRTLLSRMLSFLDTEEFRGWDADDQARALHIAGESSRLIGSQGGENAHLEDAVGLYDRALQVLDRADSPVEWAGLQNDLGNALTNVGERESGTPRLQQAVGAYRAALEVYTRERTPLDWAMTQNNLGHALARLGERQAGTAYLEEAGRAFREALLEFTRDRVPLRWAATKNNLGTVLVMLGHRESGTTRLKEAEQMFRDALQEYTRERVPLDWAMTQNNLGNALLEIGERESGTTQLEEAVRAFREALLERTRERVPLKWATTQNNLGSALLRIGERESGTTGLEEAVEAYRAALLERTRGRVPLDWAAAQHNLGVALARLGEREPGTTRLEESLEAYRAALQEYTRELSPLAWAETHFSLALTLESLAARQPGSASDGSLDQAIGSIRRAVAVFEVAEHPRAAAARRLLERLVSYRGTPSRP